MRERPILFSAPMVRAILEGRKTQTRRVAVKTSQPDVVFPCDFDAEECMLEIENTRSGQRSWTPCPYGQPGDRLWVRETWQHSNFPLGPYDESCAVFYRADYMDDPHGPDGEKSPEGKYRTWRPSIHMPRKAARLLLEVTGVRVERLQDISARDAIAEGIRRIGDGFERFHPDPADTEHAGITRDPVLAYRGVWEQINSTGSWDVNPWVWVIEFRRAQP